MDNEIKQQDMPICKRCGRRLRSPEARERGMGKICYEKSKHIELKPLINRKDSLTNGNQRSNFNLK